MVEELKLQVESKLLDVTLDDLKDVAVKLGIEDLQEGVSKMALDERVPKFWKFIQ